MRLFANCLTSVLLLLPVQAASAEIKPEVVLRGLNNPTGVTIQPETAVPFVAESSAGRIIRVVDGKAKPVVIGFPQDQYGKGPIYNIGPLGLTFLDKDHLAVADGSLPDGQDLIRTYHISAEADEPLKAENPDEQAGPLPARDDIPAEGNYYGLAVDNEFIYATANGDDAKGWIVRTKIEKDGFGELTRFLATKSHVQVDAPAAIVISPRRELVVGQMGEITDEADSLLTFYDQESKELLLSLETGLFDVVGLAYSPQTGRLYAVDYSWADPAQGGLYRLDAVRRDGKQALQATKLLQLDRPTSLAFAPSGELFITVFGGIDEPANDSATPTGQLLKIGEGL